MILPTEAGKGEHHYYLLKLDGAFSPDTANIEAGKHYLGVDAVRWYVNKQGDFLRDRMASGIVKIDLSSASTTGGTEDSYEVGLGTYELKKGARTAPFFDNVILANRLFHGGRIKFEVFISAIEQDTLLGDLLKDMAKASVNVVSGAIAAATASGPQAVLIAAGKSLTKGVTNILEKGKRAVTVFDPSGVNITLNPDLLRGPENYLLVHRGEKLDRSQLKLTSSEQDEFEVIYNGIPLDDGAWALFRLRREDEYKYPRPWENDARKIVDELDDLMDRWKFGGKAPEEVKAQLHPEGKMPPNLADKLLSVSALIRNDAVLAVREEIKKVGQLEYWLTLAQKAAEANTPQKYFEERERTDSMVNSGHKPPEPAAEIYNAESHQIATSRGLAPELVGEKLWRTLRYVGNV